MASETEFKQWFRKQFKGWSEAYEPRRGGGVGMPDVQILLDGMLLPVELKLGEFKNGRIYADNFQPAQISWHTKFWQAGGVSIIIVGIQMSVFPISESDKNWYQDVWHPVKLPPVTMEMLLERDKGWAVQDCEVWSRWLP